MTRSTRTGTGRARRLTICALAAATMALAACEPELVARRASPPLSVAPVGPTTQAAAPSTAGMVEMVNAERRARGLKPLRSDGRLAAAALRHATDMGMKGFFDHHGSDGGNHGDRIAAQGYRACLSAENIAWGQRSASEVFQGWMGSPGHRRNILHPRAAEFGAGFHPTKRQWVMVVASPC